MERNKRAFRLQDPVVVVRAGAPTPGVVVGVTFEAEPRIDVAVMDEILTDLPATAVRPA